MSVLDSAVAALETHRGVAAVAEHGLRFLASLAVAAENRVCLVWGLCVAPVVVGGRRCHKRGVAPSEGGALPLCDWCVHVCMGGGGGGGGGGCGKVAFI